MESSTLGTSLYLKYRPRRFAELGSASVRKFFEGILESGRVHHAFLLTGGRGVGKTSTARILARLVNCEKNLEGGKLSEPCNECESCLSILSGSSLDVIEVDAASNRGIDDVRNLREMVRLSPVRLKVKVFIIDECHMLTTEASNALLKILEEPPSRTMFVLCTTEADKVLPTIVSRCIRVAFQGGREEEIMTRLKEVVVGEGVEVSEESLALIAEGAGGSFRDAVKLLEQVIASHSVSPESVRMALGFVESSAVGEFIRLLMEGTLPDTLTFVEREIVGKRASVRDFCVGALSTLRDKLLKLSGLDVVDVLDINVDRPMLIALISSFDRVAREVQDAVLPSLPLELMVVDWFGSRRGQQTELRRDSRKGSVSEAGEQGRPKSVTPFRDPVPGVVGLTIEALESRWSEVLRGVKPKNHSVEAFLRSSRPVGVGEGELKLEVFYKFHKERLESPKCREILEQVLEEVYGVRLHVTYILGEKSKRRAVGEKKVPEDIFEAAEEIFGVKP